MASMKRKGGSGLLLRALVIISFFLSLQAESSPGLKMTDILDLFPRFSLLKQLLAKHGILEEIDARTNPNVTLLAPSNVILSRFHASVPHSVMGDVLRHHVATLFLSLDDLESMEDGTHSVPSFLVEEEDMIVFVKNGTKLYVNNTLPTLAFQVVHINVNITLLEIDQVLRPTGYPGLPPSNSDAIDPLNITRTLQTVPSFHLFDKYLTETGLDDVLDGRQGTVPGCTVFAPSDEAFEALPADWYHTLSREDRKLLLEYHIVEQYYSMGDLWTSGLWSTETLASAVTEPANFLLSINSTNHKVYIRSDRTLGKITATLFQAMPVIVFAIDKVLLPKEIVSNDVILSPGPASQPPGPLPSPPKPAPVPSFAPAPNHTNPPPTSPPSNSTNSVEILDPRMPLVWTTCFISLLLLMARIG